MKPAHRKLLFSALFILCSALIILGAAVSGCGSHPGVHSYEFDETTATTIQKWQHLDYLRVTQGKVVRYSDLVAKFGQPAEKMIGGSENVATFEIPREQSAGPHTVHVFFRDNIVFRIGYNSSQP